MSINHKPRSAVWPPARLSDLFIFVGNRGGLAFHIRHKVPRLCYRMPHSQKHCGTETAALMKRSMIMWTAARYLATPPSSVEDVGRYLPRATERVLHYHLHVPPTFGRNSHKRHGWAVARLASLIFLLLSLSPRSQASPRGHCIAANCEIMTYMSTHPRSRAFKLAWDVVWVERFCIL